MALLEKSGTLREMVLYDMGKKSYIYTKRKYRAQIAALKKIIDDLWVCSLIFATKKSLNKSGFKVQHGYNQLSNSIQFKTLTVSGSRI